MRIRPCVTPQRVRLSDDLRESDAQEVKTDRDSSDETVTARDGVGREVSMLGKSNPVRLIALSTVSLLALAAPSQALDFQIDFRSSTYQVTASDTFTSLLAQHQSESIIQTNITTGLENVSTTVYGNGISSNYSVLMSTTLHVGVAGEYTFQVGTDWGRGGAAALVDNTSGLILQERVITDDGWWGYSWSNPDVFTTTFNLADGDCVHAAHGSALKGVVGAPVPCATPSTVRTLCR